MSMNLNRIHWQKWGGRKKKQTLNPKPNGTKKLPSMDDKGAVKYVNEFESNSLTNNVVEQKKFSRAKKIG